MSTNFYLYSRISGEGKHLGKRSGSGLYCYACDLSLITGQRGGIDSLNPHIVAWAERTPEKCPKCGVSVDESDENKSSVRGSTSFSFAEAPLQIAKYSPRRKVVDEYGQKMTMQQFREEVIDHAKFLFTHSVGKDFC